MSALAHTVDADSPLADYIASRWPPLAEYLFCGPAAADVAELGARLSKIKATTTKLKTTLLAIVRYRDACARVPIYLTGEMAALSQRDASLAAGDDPAEWMQVLRSQFRRAATDARKMS